MYLRTSKKIFTIVFPAIFLASCYTPQNFSRIPEKRYEVSASRIVFRDYSIKDKKYFYPGAARTGWFEFADNFTTPTFSRLVSERLGSQLVARGGPHQLELTLLDARFKQRIGVGDAIPLVGPFYSLVATRQYKCSVDLQLIFGSLSSRRTFEGSKESKGAYSDSSQEEQISMVEGCMDDVLRQIVAVTKVANE